MKKEVIWFPVIVVLALCAAYVIHALPTRYGLDINGGVRAVLQANPTPQQAATYDQQTVLHVLENRLNSSGVAEPVIESKPPRQFIVELPNVSNKDAIIQQLQTTAQMQLVWFKDVRNEATSQTSDATGDARFTESINRDAQGHEQYSFTDRTNNQTFRDQAQIVADFQNKVLASSAQRAGATLTVIPAPLSQFAPQGQSVYLDKTQQATLAALNTELKAWDNFYNMELTASATLSGSSTPVPIATGADVQPNATAQLSGQGMPEPVVNVNMTPKGAQEIGNFTAKYNSAGGDPHCIMAILLDGRVLSAANTEGEFSDQFQISGGFATLAEAQSLANFLNAGALPVPLSIVEVDSVEATLGHSSVHKMELAGLIGIGLVLLFMAGYYLLPGLVADIALIIYVLFALAIFKGGLSWFIPAVTLTLPGIAGFILSVGMAVDANILIFERTKEELRNGKPLRAAVDAGFRRAFSAIRDSNICTLITCTILYTMGTPSVKGFALTLGIGVVVSLFTAITATRTMLYLLVDLGLGKNPKLFGLGRQWVTGSHAKETAPGMAKNVSPDQKPMVNVIGNRKIFYAISLLIIIPGIVFFFMGGLKKSIEFTGGTQVEVVFPTVVTQETVLKAIKPQFKDNLIQMAEGGQIAIISVADRSVDAYKNVEKSLDDAGIKYKLQSHSLVEGVISKELTTNAIEAVLIAAGLIIIYMASVFAIGGFVAGLRFGFSAIAALLHDVLVLVGSFSILGYFLNWQIDSLFVTATLTVVGFSVHDTIVIFDRLRENLHRRMKSDTFEELANRSVLQSFARSINTSLTVVLTLCAMLIFGEPSTRLLIVALLIGVVSGTYSSIFNATPILVDWENWLARRQGMAEATPAEVEAGSPAPTASSLPTPSRQNPFNRSGNTALEEPHLVKAGSVDEATAQSRTTIRHAKKKTQRRF